MAQQFAGVFASDQLPASIEKPGALIVNTEPSRLSGEHWVAIYIDKSGRGEYFDSFGRKPFVKDIVLFLDGQCPGWSFNEKRLQGGLTTVCGQYCIYYLYRRCRGLSMSNIVQYFSSDYDRNDYTVARFVARYFNITLPSSDSDAKFMFNQICKVLDSIKYV